MSIKILPHRLANQIAAGEVVERPASVIKELVENSIDANATKIDIDIDRGGSKLIKVQDNGAGIVKEQLSLALSRHATSKLSSIDDLDAILSFGFRGEALASISSVSRLTLTSHPQQQSEAWQAYTEGSAMEVKVIPTAHPIGSTIAVVDLFFNTPARRRFLKSDKTEFAHIDQWLKRIALVQPQIHFTLKHNGKLIRNYRPANTEAQYLQRLTQVTGKQFATQALGVNCDHDRVKLEGYIQPPHFDSPLADIQYFYVNGRLVRDRVLNHAVKQAFAEYQVTYPISYVLMLTLEPHQVDVNVHPAKHEVRFHQSRYIHDFILQALQSALSQMVAPALETEQHQHSNDDPEGESLVQSLSQQQPASGLNSPNQSDRARSINRDIKQSSVDSVAGQQGSRQGRNHGNYQTPQSPSQDAVSSYAQLLTVADMPSTKAEESYKLKNTMPPVLAGKYWVMVIEDSLLLIALDEVAKVITHRQICDQLHRGLTAQPLLIPVSVDSEENWVDILTKRELLLKKLGIELTIRLGQLIIKKVPSYLKKSQLADVIPELLHWIGDQMPSDDAIIEWLLTQQQQCFSSASTLWVGFERLSDDDKQDIIAVAHRLPWQTWLDEKSGE